MPLKEKSEKWTPAPGNMRMVELCNTTGYKMQTIYRFMRIGLLHRPKQEGLRPVYDESHVRMLGRIRFLREEEKLSYDEIKEILQVREDKNTEKILKNDSIKDRIIAKSIELFSKKSFQQTKITDITDAIGIAKGSFYLYFKDKRELLLECLDRVLFYIIPMDRWDEIRNEKEPVKRLTKRLEVFLSVFPDFMGIIEMVKVSLKSEDPDLLDKAKEAVRKIVRPVVRDIQWGIDNGIFNDVDPEFFAYLIIGVSEILGFRLLLDSKYSTDDVLNFFNSLISDGIYLSRTDSVIDNNISAICGVIADKNGIETNVQKIRFNNSSYLTGKMGEAVVKTDTRKIAALNVMDPSALKIEVHLKNGERSLMILEKQVDITGDCSFGEYNVYLENISHIRFYDQRP